MKGESGMLERILMALFILIIIIFAVFFLFGVEFSRFRVEDVVEQENSLIFSANALLKSDILTKDDNVFDDSKLIGFSGTDGCKDFQDLVGKDEICLIVERVKLFSSEDEIECLNLDDDCNKWVVCESTCREMTDKPYRTVRTPVNIYRKLDEETQLGMMSLREKI